MFITLGDKTINTDQVTYIDWAATTSHYKHGKRYDVPCVNVFLSTVNADGGEMSADYLSFVDYQAAQLATWFKSLATDLNMMTPDADFLHRYPKAETLEPVETPKPTNHSDELPF